MPYLPDVSQVLALGPEANNMQRPSSVGQYIDWLSAQQAVTTLKNCTSSGVRA